MAINSKKKKHSSSVAKSKATATKLAFPFGLFGVHRFYLGQKLLGILYPLLFIIGITENIIADNPDNLGAFPFFGDVKSAYNSFDENNKPLYSRSVKKYGELEPGECFGFVPALAMGGSGNLDETQRLKALEHFIIVSQLQPLIHSSSDLVLQP